MPVRLFRSFRLFRGCFCLLNRGMRDQHDQYNRSCLINPFSSFLFVCFAVFIRVCFFARLDIRTIRTRIFFFTKTNPKRDQKVDSFKRRIHLDLANKCTIMCILKLGSFTWLHCPGAYKAPGRSSITRFHFNRISKLRNSY